MHSVLPPLQDRGGAVRVVYDAVVGFGPLRRHPDYPTAEEFGIDERQTQGSGGGDRLRP